MRDLISVRDGSLNEIGFNIQSVLLDVAEQIRARQDQLGDAATDTADQMLRGTPVAGAVVAILAAIIGFGIGRWVTVPLRRLAAQTQTLAGGDVNVDIKGAEYDHDLRHMAQSLTIFRQAHIDREKTTALKVAEAREAQEKVVNAMSKAMQDLSDGDLTIRLREDLSIGIQP